MGSQLGAGAKFSALLFTSHSQSYFFMLFRVHSRDRRNSEKLENGYSLEPGSDGMSQRVGSAGKQGSAGRREEESPEESLYYNSQVHPIVEEMAAHIKGTT